MSSTVLTITATIGLIAILAAAPTDSKSSGATKEQQVKSVYDFTVKDIDGEDVSLSKYKGQVLLIVNVASECGLTDMSYAGMESLNKKYKDRGLRVLAFPANNFGSQEPGSNEEIKEFCRNDKSATFDLFAKVSVKGEDICPLYKYLTEHPSKDVAGEIQWNFQKFLVDRAGNVVAAYSPRLKPEDPQIVKRIEALLDEEASDG